MTGLKFFVAGPPRSGTSTLTEALWQSGVYAVHGQDPVSGIPLAVLLRRAAIEGRDPLHYVARGIEAVADVCMTRSPKWDGESHWLPFVPGFLGQVREHNPDCWIVLNTRPVEKWTASIKRWKDLHGRIVKADLPFLPPGAGKEDGELSRWILDFYARTREGFRGDSRFLELNIEDPEAPRNFALATGFELAWWGVKNANPEEKKA